jgi:hypothetical protein
MTPQIPISVRGPYLMGDKVKIKGTRKYGVVAGFNCAVLVRLKNGKMEQAPWANLEPNYGRR